MKIHSRNLEEVVQSFSDLPGIGQKSALRIAIYLLSEPAEKIDHFVKSLQSLSEIKRCKCCHNLADDDHCSICQDRSRNQSLICVVESIQDIMAIEETGQYRGVYHVLGGVISPIEGIGPEHLQIDSLIDRVKNGTVHEIIMAVSPTIDGETTVYYLSKMLEPAKVTISQIARGVAFGGELQYTDEVTLGRSIMARLPYAVNGND